MDLQLFILHEKNIDNPVHIIYVSIGLLGVFYFFTWLSFVYKCWQIRESPIS